MTLFTHTHKIKWGKLTMIPVNSVPFTELSNITYVQRAAVHPMVFWWYVHFSAPGMFTFGGTGAVTGGVAFLTGAAVAVAVGRGG
jgi:hypothetical protein